MTTLTNAKAFKGILQYKSTDIFTKEAGYVYFIREFNEKNEETGNAEIYFGNRKYGDVNVSQLSEIESILETKLDSNSVKTINNESLVGDGNIAVGNIISEEDDSLTIDDVNTNTYVKYVAQTLTEEQKAQVRTNIGVGEGGGTNITEQTILDWGFTKNTGTYSKPSAGIPKTDLASAVQTSLGLADTSIQSKIVTSTVRTGTVNISANTMTHLTSGLTGSTTIKITHQTVTSDAEWGVKFFINGTTVPSITFASSSTSYPITWINNTTPSFETGYMYEVTFKQFNNKYLAVCGKFKI